MFAFQICGHSNTGKTTTVTEIIKRLSDQNFQVASVKSIHFKKFYMDQPGKDTSLHRQAGANPVIASGLNETDFLYHHKMDFKEIIKKISVDWLVVEGFNEFPLPKIACGKTIDELDHFIDRRTFAISGVISQKLTEYKGLPVFNVLVPDHLDKLITLIKQKTFPLLPYVDDDCCRLCGLTCAQFVEAVVQGEKRYENCTINQSNVKLKIDDHEISIVPFVQRILRKSILGIVSELSGWEKGKKIEIILEEHRVPH